MAADVIDVSQLPAPDAIKDLSYEEILAARKASLLARFAAVGIDYDVSSLETDPGVILQEEDAARELLDKAAINDSVRAVLPAFSRGSNLEAIAARANVIRGTITPANVAAGTAAVMEDDGALLNRYLASFSAPAAGSEDGYIIRAATVWPGRRDIRVLGPEVHGRRGRAEVVLLAEAGAGIGEDVVAAVYAALNRKDARPLTDEVLVTPAIVVSWSCSAELTIRRGPDPSLVKAQAEAALRAVADQYFAIGQLMPANIVPGVLRVPNVSLVSVTSPMVDVAPANLTDLPRSAPFLASVFLTTRVLS